MPGLHTAFAAVLLCTAIQSMPSKVPSGHSTQEESTKLALEAASLDGEDNGFDDDADELGDDADELGADGMPGDGADELGELSESEKTVDFEFNVLERKIQEYDVRTSWEDLTDMVTKRADSINNADENNVVITGGAGGADEQAMLAASLSNFSKNGFAPSQFAKGNDESMLTGTFTPAEKEKEKMLRESCQKLANDKNLLVFQTTPFQFGEHRSLFYHMWSEDDLELIDTIPKELQDDMVEAPLALKNCSWDMFDIRDMANVMLLRKLNQLGFVAVLVLFRFDFVKGPGTLEDKLRLLDFNSYDRCHSNKGRGLDKNVTLEGEEYGKPRVVHVCTTERVDIIELWNMRKARHIKTMSFPVSLSNSGRFAVMVAGPLEGSVSYWAKKGMEQGQLTDKRRQLEKFLDYDDRTYKNVLIKFLKKVLSSKRPAASGTSGWKI